jgi:L,D-peptidoglycan transpeptidase YkuD (ErfK/YbiS/YcfS/YnhG family)
MFGDEDKESQFGQSLKLPYWQTTPDLKCIDDPLSRYYNRIVDVRTVPDADWSSHEEMQRNDGCYALGVVVAHNFDRPLAGAGSCIFIHVWRGAGHPTEGCTATSLEHLREICRWLDASSAPVLVQLPESEYLRLRQDWNLP